MCTGMRRIRLLFSFFVLAVCCTIGQSALAATVHVIAGKGVPSKLANEYGSVTTDVMGFFQQVYKYAPVNSIGLVIVADEQAFIQKLQLEGNSPEQAARIAKFSGGVFLNAKYAASPKINSIYTFSAGKLQCANPTIILRADKNQTYLARMRTVTHEMFHEMQWELKGNSRAHEWLVEGSATSTEHVLLEWMGKGTLASHSQMVVKRLNNIKLKADPDDVINGGPSWQKLLEENKYPYEVSESMTEYLISQVGSPPIIRYFALIGENGDRDSAFRKAFGMSYKKFLEGYEAYMKQTADTSVR